MVAFPDLYRPNTMELPGVAVFCVMSALVVQPYSPFLASLIFLPAVLIVIYWVYVAVLNSRRRRKWSSSFDGRLNDDEALERFKTDPRKYVLHVQFYSGGFDRTRLAPAAVLEDVVDGKIFAIFPSSWKVIMDCQRHDVKIVDADGLEV